MLRVMRAVERVAEQMRADGSDPSRSE
jgi:hypothetical protein